MLKFFHLTTAVSLGIALLPEIAFSNPLFVKLDYRIVPKSDTDMLVCYMHTEDGRTLDLGSLCKKQPEASDNRSNNVSAEQCYFLDADGRPCVTASNSQDRQSRNSTQKNKATTP
jgi:hypothetical protein